MTETLTRLAAEQQQQFDATTLPRMKRQRGHFGTAPAIADFMAGMFTDVPHRLIRVLDAGAGVGTLSAAICQRILHLRSPRQLILEVYENDPRIIALLEKTLMQCKRSLRAAGHEMTYLIRVEDFILDNAKHSLFETTQESPFDLAILNPPYFKLQKASVHARAMTHLVYGQPNIYAFFMAVGADLLRAGGQMVAITPRSYFNGPYFKRFRKWFFDRMTARQIHVFESRTDAFQEDEVLQENVILLAEKGGTPRDVVLTSSAGRNFQRVHRHVLPYTKVVEDSTGDNLIRVATSGLEQQIIEVVDSLPHRFRELPFKISTGPVVTFRSRHLMRRDRSDHTAPLLWMHNVRPFLTQFPPKNGKPTHIVVSDASKKLLLPAKRYVLLKRFTAKEERRRLVAGIVEPKDAYSPYLGLENHLNYVYRAGGELSKEEALGLAAFFNSALIDRYFRAISGNTQVNAAEIRAMPVPCLKTIQNVGQAIEKSSDRAAFNVEKTVGDILGLSKELLKELCESS